MDALQASLEEERKGANEKAASDWVSNFSWEEIIDIIDGSVSSTELESELDGKIVCPFSTIFLSRSTFKRPKRRFWLSKGS